MHRNPADLSCSSPIPETSWFGGISPPQAKPETHEQKTNICEG